MSNASRESIALTEVQSIETFSQPSAVRFFHIFNVIRQSLALDPDVLEHAAVAGYSLSDVVVAFPLDGRSELALVDHLFDQRPRVVVELAVAAESHRQVEHEDA